MEKVLAVCVRRIQPLDKNCSILVPDNHLTVGSLESSGLFDVVPFYYDDHFYENKMFPMMTAENYVLKWCEQEKPAFVLFSGLWKPIFNHQQVIKGLKELGIPTIYMWWDHISPLNRDVCEIYTEDLTLNLVLDLTVPALTSYPEKFHYSFYPLDSRIFNNPGIERDIGVAFMGTCIPEYFPDRLVCLSNLHNKLPFYSRTGVYGSDPLKIDEFAGILQRSRIGLSFTWMEKFKCHQCKTRTFEVISCGAMLLEAANEHTPKWFEPFKEFVPFFSEKDLAEKAQYYLEHEEERAEIARRGHERYCRDYNEKLFWQGVIEKMQPSRSEG